MPENMQESKDHEKTEKQNIIHFWTIRSISKCLIRGPHSFFIYVRREKRKHLEEQNY